jgi:hypothetical protein
MCRWRRIGRRVRDRGIHQRRDRLWRRRVDRSLNRQRSCWRGVRRQPAFRSRHRRARFRRLVGVLGSRRGGRGATICLAVRRSLVQRRWWGVAAVCKLLPAWRRSRRAALASRLGDARGGRVSLERHPCREHKRCGAGRASVSSWACVAVRADVWCVRGTECNLLSIARSAIGAVAMRVAGQTTAIV